MAPKIDYSLRLPEGEYFPAKRKKTGIAIHHTVGGTVYSTFDHWLKDRNRAGNRRVVGTAYIIARDGAIYQLFEPTAWAFQFGLKWAPARQMKFEQRFIGIEITSVGGLTEWGGKLYCFDRISAKTEKPRDEAFEYFEYYRGHKYFDKYEPVQIDRLVDLINVSHFSPAEITCRWSVRDFEGWKCRGNGGFVIRTTGRTVGQAGLVSGYRR